VLVVVVVVDDEFEFAKMIYWILAKSLK